MTRTAEWAGRFLAGVVGGGAIALGLMALVGTAFGCKAAPQMPGAQAFLWAVGASWCVIAGTSVLFRSAQRAWLTLGGAALALWGAWACLDAALTGAFP